MSRKLFSRRRFLALPVALMLAPVLRGGDRAWAEPESRRAAYTVDVGILYGILSYHLDGILLEAQDPASGRYEVKVVGEGDGIANRLESRGVLRDGRWTPSESHSFFSVKGRESRSDITYDWARRRIDYRFRGETFFLRRLRVADDVVPIPEGVHVDDSLSATLNYADDRWPAGADASYRTHVIRRKKPDNEGPDDAQASYRAELVPLAFTVSPDPESGRPTAWFDLTRFSSWARRDRPGRVTFGRDRRPEVMTLDMVLGTTVKVEVKSQGLRAS